MSGARQPFGPQQPSGLRDAAVRRCLLAVTVLHDLDLTWDPTPGAGGGAPDLWIDGPSPLLVPAEQLRSLLDGRDPERPETAAHVAHWLLLRRALQHAPLALIEDAARVVGLPAEHVTHPGAAWTRATIPGGTLALGIGLVPDLVFGDDPVATSAGLAVPLPAGLLEAVGLDPASVWPQAL